MMLEDMSFTDYLMAEFDFRERQRKERMKQAEFEKYAKEHNLFICTTNIIEQIRAEIWNAIGVSSGEYNEGYNDGIYHAIDVIDKYTKGESNG